MLIWNKYGFRGAALLNPTNSKLVAVQLVNTELFRNNLVGSILNNEQSTKTARL